MMKASITILLLCHAVQIVLVFELHTYSSMDDARSAIMTFYDPIHVKPETKAKETNSKNIPVKVSLSKPVPTRPTLKSLTSKRVSKFAKAIEDIEKALAAAQIVRSVTHNKQRLWRLRDLIEIAVQKRSYRFARKAIGEAMYTIERINGQR